ITSSTLDVPCLYFYMEILMIYLECEICLKLTVVERASFDDQINNDNSFKIIGNFIDTQFQSCLNEELKIKRNLLNYHDTFIHILFIFYYIYMFYQQFL
ncbi:unnamed protein product, partial [Rotaria sp. Silwood1]